MSAGAFEKSNFSWQLQQLQQQAGEWLELQLSQFNPTEVSWPSLPADWSWLQPVSLALFWITLGLLLIWLALRLLRLWPEIWSAFPSLLGNSAVAKATPLEGQLTPAAWQQRASEFQRIGNYREACRALYMAMLQRLHDTGTAQNLPSRTDGEYRQLLGQHSKACEILLLTHERLCFGSAEPALEDFRRCQQAYRQISLEAKLK